MSEPVDVGPVERFEPGVPTIVEVEARQLAVVRWGDAFFAVRNVCPHQTQSFINGKVHLEVHEEPRTRTLVLDRERPVIACPWHGWTFGLTDGRCTVDPQLRIRTYDVVVDDGRVFVSRR